MKVLNCQIKMHVKEVRLQKVNHGTHTTNGENLWGSSSFSNGTPSLPHISQVYAGKKSLGFISIMALHFLHSFLVSSQSS